MYKGKTICVVVPAYEEEKLLPRVVRTMPEFVDRIVVVDDASPDGTLVAARAVASEQPERVIVLHHERNQGVGGAIVTGYLWARDHDMDVAVVMAGDAQMDPEDLPALLNPVVEGRADYSKGNRLFTGDAWKKIPHVRYLGNAGLSLLTKIASGYWHVADSQTGYTAINLAMLRLIDWERTYKRYGCPNDYLVRLNVFNARVADVPVNPVYDVGQKSGIRLLRDVPRLSWLLLRLFLWRLIQKYVIRDFHPLVFFYGAGFVTVLVALALFIRLLVLWVANGYVPQMTALAFGFFSIVSLQFTMFAMWFDMEANRGLRA
ncbi:MAG: glycosyltransferase family 2 protein [Candidatus Bipolaricaulia bacterium]